ncbi:RTA1-domain-containing protein [Penicillium tannophilum]|nr:RTA1-domain-containing protein [Penicillium tannophilum]
MAKLEPYKGGYYLWKYVPSLAAAIIFIILFICTTAFHLFKLWKNRARFCIPFAIGGIFEIIGYFARAFSHNNTASIMPFAIQNVFILLGPVLFAASVYMTLGRIISAIGAKQNSLIPIRWLTKTFVAGDILSFVVQGGAAGLMVTGSNAGIGQDIEMVGLLIQVIMFAFFVVTALVFQIRTQRDSRFESGGGLISWKRHLYLLYAVSLLIMVRSIFRVVEYGLGTDGYPLTHEWTLYIFDSLLMWLVMVSWLIWYPGELSRPESSVELN